MHVYLNSAPARPQQCSAVHQPCTLGRLHAMPCGRGTKLHVALSNQRYTQLEAAMRQHATATNLKMLNSVEYACPILAALGLVCSNEHLSQGNLIKMALQGRYCSQ